MIQDMILSLRQGVNLDRRQAKYVAHMMLAGDTTLQENIDLLTGLLEKGDTDEELLGMLETMQEFSLSVDACPDAIDMCGTGGDMLQTFNVSTAASFVAAASGASVAKHGNRSSSGIMGSADIFECLGYDLDAGSEHVAGILARHRICFMFAQKFHPAMRHAGPARKIIGKRTVFNLLGPLANPASVRRQLVGVSSPDLVSRLPCLLERRGALSAMTVCAACGADEFSTSCSNMVGQLRDGRLQTYTIRPEDVGLGVSSLSDIVVRTRRGALESFVGVLEGTANKAMIETAALNAAGGLVVSGIADCLADGVQMSLEAIRGGAAYRLLRDFVADTGDVSKLEEIHRGQHA